MLSKSELLLMLLIFYAILSVFMGMIGASLSEEIIPTANGVDEDNNLVKKTNLFTNVVKGYSSFEWWTTLIIFTPFITTLLWIVFSSFPTINGGS